MDFDTIEKSIRNMDYTYDANFGEWIRNEENSRIIGHNLKKYIDKYPTAKFIIVIKWIVKDWTLRSIIYLVKKMVIDDVKKINDSKNRCQKCRSCPINKSECECNINSCFCFIKNHSKQKSEVLSLEKYKKRIDIIRGLIFTWNAVFIAEFILSVTRSFETDEKLKFIDLILDEFPVEKINELLVHLGNKIETRIRHSLVRNAEEKRYVKKSRKKSIIEAYNIS